MTVPDAASHVPPTRTRTDSIPVAPLRSVTRAGPGWHFTPDQLPYDSIEG